MYRYLALSLILLAPAGRIGAATPDSVITYLMLEPVTLLDYGMWRLEKEGQEALRNGRDLKGFPAANFSVLLEEESETILLSVNDISSTRIGDRDVAAAEHDCRTAVKLVKRFLMIGESGETLYAETQQQTPGLPTLKGIGFTCSSLGDFFLLRHPHDDVRVFRQVKKLMRFMARAADICLGAELSLNPIPGGPAEVAEVLDRMTKIHVMMAVVSQGEVIGGVQCESPLRSDKIFFVEPVSDAE